MKGEHGTNRLYPYKKFTRGGGGTPLMGLMGMCSQSGYVFWDFCLKQGIDFYHFVLNRVSFLDKFLK